MSNRISEIWKESTSSQAVLEEPPPTKTSRKRVLLIEDDMDLNLALAGKLCHSGYDVDSVFDGERGLQKGMTKKPDLVLLDLRLPKLSGWEILKTMQSVASTAQIPVIVITGDSTIHETEEECPQAIKKVLHKPISPRQLAQTVNEFLGGAVEGEQKTADPFYLGGGDHTYRPRDFLWAVLFFLMIGNDSVVPPKEELSKAQVLEAPGNQKFLSPIRLENGDWRREWSQEPQIGIYRSGLRA